MSGRRARSILPLLALAACAGPTTEYVPAQLDDGWTVGTLAAAGLDADSMATLTRAIENGEYPNTHAVLVEHDGVLVYEAYFSGTDERWGEPLGQRAMGRDSLHDLRSITKSVTSLLLGIALGGGADSMLGRPLASFFPDRQFGRGVERVTLDDALTMTAGLEWNEMTVPYTSEANDEIRLYATTDPVGYVLSRPVVEPPGETWYYNGGLSQVVAAVIQRLSGRPADAYAETVLFEPLGIVDFEWLGDPDWDPPMPAAASGLRLRARDLAKIGSLVLHGGRWHGTQVVPESWIAVSGRRHVREAGEWSKEGTWGYGYLWWLGTQPDGHVVIAGVGNGNQRLFVIPADHLVVTIFAGEYNRFEGYSDQLMQRIHDARHGPRAVRH